MRGSYTHRRAGLPKSGRVRSVPLIDQAARSLDALSRRELFTGPDDLVFCTEVGEYLNDDRLRERFYDALAAAGLGDKRAGSNPMVFTTYATRSERSRSRRGRCTTWRRSQTPSPNPGPSGV